MLHVPVGAQSFGLTTPSWGTTRPAAANGTSVTPGTSSEGSWTAVGSALSYDGFGLLININSAFTASTPRNYVVDIGFDPAGGTSFTETIRDLLAGGATTYAAGGGCWYYFPIYIPAGTAIGARAQGTNATALRVGWLVMQRPMNPSMVRKGSFCETIGLTAGAIVGTAVTAGTTSEGSWTSIGSTTNRL